MKKLLALILLSPLAVSEEVEYPIELTCELGASIVYLHIAETKENSWWMPHDSHQFGNKFKSTFFNNENFKNKKNNNFIRLKITDGQIRVDLSGLNIGAALLINRYTLKADNPSGQCYKGFKEYSEKQI